MTVKGARSRVVGVLGLAGIVAAITVRGWWELRSEEARAIIMRPAGAIHRPMAIID